MLLQFTTFSSKLTKISSWSWLSIGLLRWTISTTRSSFFGGSFLISFWSCCFSVWVIGLQVVVGIVRQGKTVLKLKIHCLYSTYFYLRNQNESYCNMDFCFTSLGLGTLINQTMFIILQIDHWIVHYPLKYWPIIFVFQLDSWFLKPSDSYQPNTVRKG